MNARLASSTLERWAADNHASGWDSEKNYIGKDLSEWFKVVSYTRDSEILSKCNFDIALERLGGEKENCVLVAEFGHWACGWFKWLLIHESAPAELFEKAEEIVESIEAYPILDENEYSKRCDESRDEEWKDWGRRHYADLIDAELCDGSFDTLCETLPDLEHLLYRVATEESGEDLTYWHKMKDVLHALKSAERDWYYNDAEKPLMMPSAYIEAAMNGEQNWDAIIYNAKCAEYDAKFQIKFAFWQELAAA